MKLLTHNLLMCNKKGCTTNNYPLKLVVNEFRDIEQMGQFPCTPQFMERMADKVDWAALRATVATLDWNINLPEQVDLSDKQTVADVHLLLVRR